MTPAAHRWPAPATAARTQPRAENTPAARRHVAERWTRVDGILDTWDDVLLTSA